MLAGSVPPTYGAAFAIFYSAATYILTRIWIGVSEKRGLVSRDLHKPYEVWGAKIGGLPASLLMITAPALAFPLLPNFAYPLLTASVFFASMGLIDDIIGLSNAEKIILSGIPFLLLQRYLSEFWPFNLTEPLNLMAIVLFGIYEANAFNTLAGFNGLEASTSLVIYVTLALLMLAKGDPCWIILLIESLIILAFLPYNWFPAKAFPGNVMTFLLGGFIGFVSAERGLYWPLITLTLPHGLDFLFKLVSWKKTERKIPTGVMGDGTLIAPPNKSLAWFLIKVGFNREEKLVRAFLVVESILSFITLLIYLPR